MATDDPDFQERVAYVFKVMDRDSSGSVSYIQFLHWWKDQAKAAGEGHISEDVLNASRGAFTEYDINQNGSIEVDEVGALLAALDLLKYIPEEVRTHSAPFCVCL